MSEQLNFSGLLPKIDSFSFPPATTDDLSASFVFLLLFITLFFLCISLVKSFGYIKNIRWLSKQLEGVTTENVPEKRQKIRDAADKKSTQIAHQWKEFDDTLVEEKLGKNIKLYNTFDAAYFFNPHTLASAVTENRMIAAVPGFLTAIGVIGTFMGLQLGLSDLNISGDADFNQMKDGVAGVINGAKLAFMTSVWGVVLSVSFNLIEKLIEQGVRKSISRLQHKIDKIFPRLSVETQLQTIALHGGESREALQGLAEKIGEKMQESLVQSSQSLQDGLEASLNKIMAPAINKLVDETSDSSSKALESILTSFMQGFGQQGEQQRAAIDQASQSMNNNLSLFGKSIEAFIHKVESSQTAAEKREQALIHTLSAQVTELVEQSNEQKKMLTEFVQSQMNTMSDAHEKRELSALAREEKMVDCVDSSIAKLVNDVSLQSKQLSELIDNKITSLTDSFSEQTKRSTQMEKERNESFVAQTEMMITNTLQLVEKLNLSLDAYQGASNQILEQGSLLQSQLDSSILASNKASEKMNQSADKLSKAADEMSLFSDHIKNAGQTLSNAVTDAVKSTGVLAEQNKISAQKMESLREHLLEDVNHFNQLADKITAMISTADSTFESLKESQHAFLTQQQNALSEVSNEMKEDLQSLAGHVSEFLDEYSTQANSQTQEHLRIWSTSATQYASQMNNAVKALSSVVDEIEAKVSH